MRSSWNCSASLLVVATLAALPRTTFQVPPISATAPFGNTPLALEIAPAVNLFPAVGDVTAFTMVIHVDNNLGTAIIHPTSVGAITEGPCGFITYGAGSDPVNLSFQASHPFNFATFSFGVYKGTSRTGVFGRRPSRLRAGWTLSHGGRHRLRQ